MKVVFFGSSRYVIPILEILRKHYDLALVVTTERNAVDAVSSHCRKRRIPYVSVSSSHELTTNHELRTINSPVAVLAYFGLILPKEVLQLFPKGILNVHPSLLPKYRGPTPGQTAILRGDKITGVTLIRLDEKVDHGPILAQVKEPIRPTDTAETLYERLFSLGAKLLSQNINKYIKGELKASKQDESWTTYTKRLSRQDGFIDVNNPPTPKKLDWMVRAYYPWPGVWCKWRMLASRSGENGKLRIIKFLPGRLLQMEGKKPISFKDFLNGYPEASSFVNILYRA